MWVGLIQSVKGLTRTMTGYSWAMEVSAQAASGLELQLQLVSFAHQMWVAFAKPPQLHEPIP